MSENQEWSRWENYVIEKLKSLESRQHDLLMEMHGIRLDIAMLKVKAGIWGAVGAAIPIVGLLLFELLTKRGTP